MKKIYFTFCFLLLSYGAINSQETSNKTTKYNYSFKEKVFLHYNSSLLITGEYLQYKIYTLRERNKKISRLSKIAYVELINNSKKVIFKHKIRLQKGVGSGEFFIPASLNSGNYKLISYTQGMRNEGEDYIFQADISILNPFKTIDKNSIVEDKNSKLENVITTIKNNIKEKDYINENLDIITTSKKYSTRSKVTIDLKSLNNNSLNGNYSISVRKVSNLSKPYVLNSKTFSNNYPKKEAKKFYQTNFIPEFEGDIIMGKVYLNNTEKEAASNVKVVLSIPTNDNQVLKFAETDTEGNFIYILKSKFSASNATIQVLSKEKEKYIVEIKQKAPKDYSTLVFPDFKISTNTKNSILQSSIQNQIENSYQSIKLDSISDNKNHQNYFFKKSGETFLLDDYTRFPTVKETITEVVRNTWTKRKRGNYSFHVAKLNPYDKEDLAPIIIIDGILTQDLNKVAEFDARKVKSINVVREKFYYKDFKFQGIISITTFNNDFNTEIDKSYLNNFSLFTPIKNRKYYSQKYDESTKYDRIPDYRKQLLWEPYITPKNNKSITFYTSDVKGLFEISIEGFNNNGTPVSSKKLITVE